MAPLFSKVDSNKLWHDVQHEENMLYAQFGKDLFNISKVIGRKKVAQFFWLTVYNVCLKFLRSEKSQCKFYFSSMLIWLLTFAN